MNKRVYVDTEYMYDDMFFVQRMPKDTDKKQIIQIAAILFDTSTGKELDHFDVLVKPIFHEKLPDFFVKLTSITQDDVDMEGIEFIDALRDFSDFVQDYPIWTFNNDYHVFQQNCDFHTIDNPFSKPFEKVKPKLSTWNIDPEKYSSGTLYKAVGLQMDGHVHYALHDVRSMAHAVHILENKDD